MKRFIKDSCEPSNKFNYHFSKSPLPIWTLLTQPPWLAHTHASATRGSSMKAKARAQHDCFCPSVSPRSGKHRLFTGGLHGARLVPSARVRADPGRVFHGTLHPIRAHAMRMTLTRGCRELAQRRAGVPLHGPTRRVCGKDISTGHGKIWA